MSAKTEQRKTLADIRRAGDWRRDPARGARIFRTDAAFEWFVRRHRRELVESGAVIPRSGAGGSLVNEALIDEIVLGILVAEARDRLEKEGGDADAEE